MWREESHTLIDHRKNELPLSSENWRGSASRRHTFLFAVLIIINRIVFTDTAYQRSKCEHHFINYSLEWAFEPQLKNMIFVLRTTAPISSGDDEPSHTSLWPAVAFGSRQNDSFLEMLGIVPNMESLRLVTAFIDTSMGTLGWHSPISTYDSARQIDVGVDASNNMIVAKFAHKISGDSNGCMTLNIPEHGPTLLRANRPVNIDKLFKPLIVCEIERYCTVDVRQLHRKQEEISLKKTTKNNAEEEKKLKDDEIAHSVDISGTGDPCSFAGVGYTVNWTYNRASDCVDFVMRHPVKKGKWWSAVGIGDTMADMDIGVVFLESGLAKKIIDYFSSGYTVPDIDSHQDWILHSRKSKIISNGEHDDVELYFSRKIDTIDAEKDRSMDGCVLFQFAANSGSYGAGFALRKHEDWPDLYKACDLKARCLSTTHHPHETEDIGELAESLDESGLNSTKILDSRESNANETDISENALFGGEDPPDTEDSSIISILSEKPQDNVEESDVVTEAGENSTIPQSVLEEDENDLISSTNETSAHFVESHFSKHSASTLRPPNNSPTTTNLPSTIKAETSSENTANRANAPRSSTGTTATTTLIHSTSHTEKPENKLTDITLATHSTTKPAETTATIEEITHTRPVNFTTLPPNDNHNSAEPSVVPTSGPPSTTKHQSITTSTSSQTKKSTQVPNPIKPEITLPTHSASTLTSTRSSTTVAPTPSPTSISSAKTGHTAEPSKTTTKLTTNITTSTTKSTPASTKLETKWETSNGALKTQGLLHTTQSPPTSSGQASTRGTKVDGCDPTKPDLDICEKYMTDYFARVKVWADNNGKPMEKQYGKACYLLNEVKNVPTMCCHIFNTKCAAHL